MPVNPYNLKNPKRDMAIIALFGPLANILLASLVAILIRLNGVFNFSSSIINIFITIVYLNVLWMVFNLVPIPPLDGSKILFYFVKNEKLEKMMYQFGVVFLMVIIMYGFGPIQNITGVITKVLIGG